MPNITIVGGGTAGWMAAAYISKNTDYSVRLIESEEIKTIGVGESTIPSIVDFLDSVGITEQELFDHCGAVRKYTIKHHNWNNENETWDHPFCFEDNEHAEQQSWMDSYVVPNKKWRWAYHLDALKFVDLLKSKSTVEHVKDNINKVNVDNGKIISVQGRQEYFSDFFIDCTGFKALLRNSLSADYITHKNLVNNCAIAAPGSYKEKEECVPYTETYAMDYGWMWKVTLQHRTGNGYCFDKNLISIEQAKEEFLRKTKAHINPKDIFVVNIENKYNPEPWKSNCLALGLSCGFLEPLEATGLFLIHYSLFAWHRLHSKKEASKTFNRLWKHTYTHIADFLSMQYVTSSRTDTSYWKRFKKISKVELPISKQTIFDRYSFKRLAIGRGLPHTS